MKHRLTQLAIGVLAPVALALLIGALVIALTGGNVSTAYSALWTGALGGAYQRSETIVRAVPLLFTGLAVAVAFRAGIWNIGAEGQLLVGALAVAAVAKVGANWPGWALIPLCLTAAVISGSLWSAIAAFLKIRRQVPEVISTIMLNFLAINLVGALIHGPMMKKSGHYPETEPLPLAAVLPRLFPPNRIHAGVLIAALVAVLVGVWLFRTVHGYRVRMVGLNAQASRSAGFPTTRIVWQVFLLSGALAGLCGGVELMSVTNTLSSSFSPGWGYTAIAVALLGGLQPAGVAMAALLFGALDAGAAAMESQAGVSHVVVEVIQGVIILAVAIRAALAWRAAPET